MATIRPGFTGIARIGGFPIRCSSFDVNPKETALFYDHVIGVNDTVPGDDRTKGEQPGSRQNMQQHIWRPSTIEVSGGMSFPVVESILPQFLFDSLAKNVNYFNLSYAYHCEHVKTFQYCRINTFEFKIDAPGNGEISIGVMGKNVDESGILYPYKEPEKIVTWDNYNINVSNYPLQEVMIYGIDFKIDNNLQNIYTNDSLYPHDIRAGMQTVSGNLSIYMQAGQSFIPVSQNTPAIINIASEHFNVSLRVVFETYSISGAIGPIATSLPFVGVSNYFGL